MSQGGDPRTTGITVRYRFPYPLAVGWTKLYSTRDDQRRIEFLKKFVQDLMRYVCYLSLSDALASGVPDKRARRWFKAIESPSEGKFRHVIVESCRFLSDTPDPFSPELQEFVLSGEWDRLVEPLHAFRRDDAHRFSTLPRLEGRRLLDGALECLRALLCEMQFLGDLVVGSVVDERRVSGGLRLYWSGCRGQEEECELVSLVVQDGPPCDAVSVVDPRRGRALVLSPLLVRTGESDVAHMRWLDGVADSVEWDGKRASYSHPVLHTRGGMLFPDIRDEEAEGVSFEEYFAARSQWHRRYDLGLDEASALRLLNQRVPSTSARYRVVGKLGGGAFGTVWEVRDVELDQRRAMKILRSELVQNLNQVKRFRREARALAMLDAISGVARVFDYGLNDDGQPFILMELVEGRTLDDLIKNDQVNIEPAEALDIVDALLRTLEDVHRHGITHRDIKPANVMFGPTGVKLIDFGIARNPNAEVLTRSGTSAVMGTMPYMAPEQFDGMSGPASDQFAVGRTLFALLAGRDPHPVRREALSEGLLGVPPDLEAIYERATAPDPEDRFPGVEALRESLTQARHQLLRSLRPRTAALEEFEAIAELGEDARPDDAALRDVFKQAARVLATGQVVECPLCRSDVKKQNLVRHFDRQHGAQSVRPNWLSGDSGIAGQDGHTAAERGPEVLISGLVRGGSGPERASVPWLSSGGVLGGLIGVGAGWLNGLVGGDSPKPEAPSDRLPSGGGGDAPGEVSRYDRFVGWGRSGRREDVDRLMLALAENDDIATTKLVDYSLSLVDRKTGRARIRHYLFEGSQRQRNYAALYFKRRGDVGVLEEAVSKGRVSRLQAFSR